MTWFCLSVVQYLAMEAVEASSSPARCLIKHWSTKVRAIRASVLHSANLNLVFLKIQHALAEGFSLFHKVQGQA